MLVTRLCTRYIETHTHTHTHARIHNARLKQEKRNPNPGVLVSCARGAAANAGSHVKWADQLGWAGLAGPAGLSWAEVGQRVVTELEVWSNLEHNKYKSTYKSTYICACTYLFTQK